MLNILGEKVMKGERMPLIFYLILFFIIFVVNSSAFQLKTYVIRSHSFFFLFSVMNVIF